MKEFVEKLIERLEKELYLADKDKKEANVLQFDRAVGYGNGIAVALEIVNQLAEEYNNTSTEQQRLAEQKVQQGALMEEKYTLEQIIDAIVQADEAVIVAIRTKDREMLEDAIKDFLT